VSIRGLRCNNCNHLKLGLDLTEIERSRFMAEHLGHNVDIWETVEGRLVWHAARAPFAVGVSLEAWLARFTGTCVCRGNPFAKCECPCTKCRGRMVCINVYGPG
jgi:hypothetical protein